jgi:hypothetical protein
LNHTFFRCNFSCSSEDVEILVKIIISHAIIFLVEF